MTGFLFDPAAVAEILAELPHLAASVPSPHREGRASDGFPKARRSDRHLYRMLGNTHYEHLRDLLWALDLCIGRGFRQPRLLRTRDRGSFASAVAELGVATHFARLGADIAGFDDAKGEAPVPDLLVEQDGVTLAVEVYAPRVWDTLDNFHDDLAANVNNLDQPRDFHFELDFARLAAYDGQGHLLHHFPHVLDEGLSRGRGEALGAALIEALNGRLAIAQPSNAFTIESEAPEMNLCLTLALDRVKRSEGRLPSRSGVTHGPSTTSPAPEGIFANIVERRVLRKARESQAQSVPDAQALLVVDLDRADLTSELRDGAGRPRLLNGLGGRPSEGWAPDLPVLFVSSAGWNRPLIPWFLWSETPLPTEVRRLFDPDDRLGKTSLPSWSALVGA